MLRFPSRIVVTCLFAAIAPVWAQTLPAKPVTLKSPDGTIELAIATIRHPSTRPTDNPPRGGQALPQPDGQLAYQVTFRGKPVLDWSNLGLATEASPVLGAAVRIEHSEATRQDDTWNCVAGKANPIRNHFNTATVQTVETTENGRHLNIEARAYDDGVAFRYVVPEQPGVKELRIMNEATQFHFVKDPTTWSMISRGFQTSNEDDYHELTVRALHPEYLLNLPMLLEVPGVAWIGLTEADLENYPNLFVTAVADESILTARLATRVEDINTNANIAASFDPKADAAMVSVITQAPMNSPWRVLMIGAEPGRLIESNLVMNLNPPTAIADTSWIKPGKTAWNWWNGNIANGVSNAGMNNETMKYYIDFASRMGFEYMLIDAGWAARVTNPPGTPRGRGAVDLTQSISDIDIPMLVEYGKSKNVRLWLWAHFVDMNRQMDDVIAQMEKWGIAGIKIDYMDRSDQWMVNWYRTVAQKAADHHLMLDYHGAFKPDGIERTFPNVMTCEGVMGAEYNKWSARETPKHNVSLAFTRMLAGPMDYTPGGFENVTREEFNFRNRAPMVMTTRAHATALYVILQSAFQGVADHPDAYTGQKESEFIKAVPATWDETRVINGVPPKFVTIARRHGQDWFVGSITDEPRELDVPLTFLGDGKFTAEIYADGPNATAQPKDSVMNRQAVDAKSVLRLTLANAGGAAIRIMPAQ